jgi:phage gp36-like protein
MYANLQMLLDRYGEEMLVQLTDRAVPASGIVDVAAVERALADADALIDGYLAGRYRLPLAAVPALVADLAQAVAIYRLHREVAAEKITADYRDALRTLGEIARGAVRLDVAGVEPAASGSSGVQFSGGARVLSEQSLKGFI